ncbi:MAG: TIGR00300 family protein [Thermoprotei archaeon]|nr:TIGR00300 family protein [Thermoprotei archaeon]
MKDAKLAMVREDGILPSDFFVTSNRRTWVMVKGKKIEVEDIRMDCAIVVDPEKMRATCLEPRKIKKGMYVVVGNEGIIEEGEMEFMLSAVSSERPAVHIINEVIRTLLEVKRRGGRIFVVAGPAVIHAGGREALAQLIRWGYVDVLIAGNGLAVHDMEASIYGTSLGVSLRDGRHIHHAHHIWTINRVNACGSIKDAVNRGLVKDGIMYECVKNDVKYILVGSIRDDGPLKDTITDMIKAQDMIREEIKKGVDLVLALATMLLTIGVCNMLPYEVKVIVVDINPAVISKVYDRGSQQVVGVVTDVGLFLRELIRAMERKMSSY